MSVRGASWQTAHPSSHLMEQNENAAASTLRRDPSSAPLQGEVCCDARRHQHRWLKAAASLAAILRVRSASLEHARQRCQGWASILALSTLRQHAGAAGRHQHLPEDRHLCLQAPCWSAASTSQGSAAHITSCLLAQCCSPASQDWHAHCHSLTFTQDTCLELACGSIHASAHLSQEPR